MCDRVLIARTAQEDYISINSTIITFSPGSTEVTVDAHTIIDNVAENVETFEIFLTPSSTAVVVQVGVGATVEIVDSSMVLIEFDPVEISLQESGGMISFGIVKRMQTTETVSVLFSTLPVTAGLHSQILIS